MKRDKKRKRMRENNRKLNSELLKVAADVHDRDGNAEITKEGYPLLYKLFTKNIKKEEKK